MPAKRKSDVRGDKAEEQQKKHKSSGEDNLSDWEDTGSEPSSSKEPSKDPHGYYVIARSQSDVEKENDSKAEDDQLDEDELENQFFELAGGDRIGKPASDFPDCKWIGMDKTWQLSQDYHIRATYTCPDLFSMYIYNDFCGYGVLECIENALLAIDAEFKKKSDKKDPKEMWALTAAMIHWISNETVGPYEMVDDGDRVLATDNLIGRCFVSSLNELDLAGMLNADDSPIKDLGLVMSIYLQWTDDQDMDGANDDEDEDTEWREKVLAYAKKAKLDLKAAGLHGIDEIVEKLESESEDNQIGALAGVAKADRWKWKKALSEHTKSYAQGAKLGGEHFNILKMSRKERADANFDHKDPLADFSLKDLKEGKIMIQGR